MIRAARRPARRRQTRWHLRMLHAPLAVAATLGALGACTPHDAAPAMATALPTFDSLPASTRARLARTQMLFGHQSVGRNIMAGIRELARSDPSLALALAPLDAPSPQPATLRHFEVGTNGDPDSKGAAFARILAERAPDSVMAGYELCYLDFTRESDAEKIFARYQQVMDSVRTRHPTIRLVHFTAPLTVEEPWLKGAIKRALGRTTTRSLNRQRAAFNARMRAAYHEGEPLFDLARAESTLEDGRRRSLVVDGLEVEALAPEFAADEGHLNARGRAVVASRFLAFLATLP